MLQVLTFSMGPTQDLQENLKELKLQDF